MPLESSRLSMKTAVEARLDPVVAISTEEPPRTYLARSASNRNVFFSVSQAPVEAGQIAAVVDPLTNIPGLRCVVPLPTGELIWVPVNFGKPSNKFSGQRFNPLASQLGQPGP